MYFAPGQPNTRTHDEAQRITVIQARLGDDTHGGNARLAAPMVAAGQMVARVGDVIGSGLPGVGASGGPELVGFRAGGLTHRQKVADITLEKVTERFKNITRILI